MTSRAPSARFGNFAREDIAPQSAVLVRGKLLIATGATRYLIANAEASRGKTLNWASSVALTETAGQLGQRSRPLAFAGSGVRSSNPVKGEPYSLPITWRNASSEAKSPIQGKGTHRAPARSVEGSPLGPEPVAPSAA